MGLACIVTYDGTSACSTARVLRSEAGDSTPVRKGVIVAANTIVVVVVVVVVDVRLWMCGFKIGVDSVDSGGGSLLEVRTEAEAARGSLIKIPNPSG